MRRETLMMVEMRVLRGAVLAALLLVGAVGLTGCGEDAKSPAPASSEGAGSGGTESPGGESPSSEAPESDAPPTETTGQPLPDGWPKEYLVPAGEVVLVQPIGGSVSVLVEGVDSDQAKGLIEQMVAAGLSSASGVAELGNGEWTAEVSGADYRASYAYAGGGAGRPNVTIMLSPDQ